MRYIWLAFVVAGTIAVLGCGANDDEYDWLTSTPAATTTPTPQGTSAAVVGSPTPTVTSTPSGTNNGGSSPTATPTVIPTAIPTPTSTPTTLPPTATPTPSPTATPLPTPSPTPTPTQAPGPAGFIVNSTSDAPDASPGNGVCRTAAGLCTLRAAIQEANALGVETTVTLPAGNYLLTQGEIAISATVTIEGETGTTVDGGRVSQDGSRASRLFHVLPSGDLRLSSMILQNGARFDSTQDGVLHGGGAVANEGRLTIESALIRNSYADVQGGSIMNLGAMTLTDVTISGGGVQYVGGAGVYNGEGAEATITRARIEGNECSHSSQGGGIYNAGVMSVAETTLQDNFSVNGSNIRNTESGRLTIRGSTLVGGNEWEDPGGISNDGEIVDDGGNSFGP